MSGGRRGVDGNPDDVSYSHELSEPGGASAHLPVEYREDMKRRFLEGVAGGESIDDMAGEEGMPGKGVLLRLLAVDRHFKDAYIQAQRVRTMMLSSEMAEIADDDSRGIPERKISLDTRKWLLERLLPEFFGAPKDSPAGTSVNVNLGKYEPPTSDHSLPGEIIDGEISREKEDV